LQLKFKFLSLKKYLKRSEDNLVVLTAICLLICAFYFVLYPKLIRNRDLKSQLEEALNTKTEYINIYENDAHLAQKAAKYIPKNKEIPKFLKDIERWSNDKQVKIVSIYPDQTRIEHIGNSEINVIPIEISAEGIYEVLLEFLDEMENYSRFLKVEELSLEAIDSLPLDSFTLCKLTARISLYYL